MRPHRPSLLLATVLSLGLTTLPAYAATAGRADPTRPAEVTTAPRPAKPAGLKVRVIARGLDHPWEVQPLPGRRLLVTERERLRLTVVHKRRTRPVAMDTSGFVSSGEIGLMGLEVDPDFARNRTVYLCHGFRSPDGSRDIRVTSWQLTADYASAAQVGTLVTGLPLGPRHGGCRLLILRDGSLLVGTGDAAQPSAPRDLGNLGGKTLRVDRTTGAPAPGNPFPGSPVYTFGHRNVQGLAERRDGSLWAVEQGTDRDDEVNRLVAGGDYGWHPVPGYDEDRPMTDQDLPGDQVGAAWSSGFPTLAISGGTFVPRQGWGRLGGTLAVAALKASRLVFLKLTKEGRVRSVKARVKGHGRLRTVSVTPRGHLLVPTDNGGGRDVILRVRRR